MNILNNIQKFNNITEAISYGYLCDVKNSIIINLKKEEDQLMNEMNQYQRKHIRKSKRQGLVIKAYRGTEENIDIVFDSFQSAHLESAGRL